MDSNIDDENQIHENDILIIRSNGSRDLVGKSVLVPRLSRSYTYASFLIRIQPTSVVVPQYLVVYLNSPECRAQMFKKAKSSAGINNINSKELGGIQIGLPSISEQREIVRILGIIFDKEQQTIGYIQAVLKKIEEKLKDNYFVRCNNCYLVNLRYVTAVKGYSVYVDGEELKISQPRKKEFMRALNNYLGSGG